MAGEDRFLSNPNASIEIPFDYAESALKAIEAYKREKVFLCAAYFIVGRIRLKNLNKNSKLCAPLVFYEAKIKKNGEIWHVTIDRNSVKTNVGLLNELLEKQDSQSVNLSDIFTKPLSIDTISPLMKEYGSDDLDTSQIKSYPNLLDSDALNKLLDRTTQNKKLVSAIAFLLTKRSVHSRGILHELKQIARQEYITGPVRQIIYGKVPPADFVRKPDYLNIPGLLSKQQKKALENAAVCPFSMVIGPPGTGKSYTIASMVLDRFLKGETVLIASNNEAAVDVVLDKLFDSFGISANSIMRAGNSDYLKALKNYVNTLLTEQVSSVHPKQTLRKVAEKKKLIAKLERLFFKRCYREISRGLFLDRYQKTSSLGKLLGALRLRLILYSLKKAELLFQQFSTIQTENEKREALLSELISQTQQHRLNILLNRNRKDFVQFSKALRARSGKTQEKYYSMLDYTVLLKAMPIWLVSIASLHKILPLHSGLFDLVIIDEATQCDLPSCIPVLYRANRAVVVGDPKQLRFISFLSREKQNSLIEKHSVSDSTMELNYRDHSMIDYANLSVSSQKAIVTLDEHYRSLPRIVQFNNQHFYNGRLKIMTEKPGRDQSTTLELIICDGKRNQGINKQEIEQVIAKLDELLQAQNNFPANERLSIGVLSFFRSQSERLQKLIFKKLELSVIKQHKIRVGTPYSFQGEERDIMLISCGVDSHTGGSTYRYLDRQDVFNVATSRARIKQILFLSATLKTIPKRSLLYKYVQHIVDQTTTTDRRNPELDIYQEEVCEMLNEQGLHTYKNYSIAGIPIDIVVLKQNKTLAVDLVGFPGKLGDVLELNRYKLFERAGVAIFPMSYSAWVFKRQLIISQINNIFNASDKDIYNLSAKAYTRDNVLPMNLLKLVHKLRHGMTDLPHDRGLNQLALLEKKYVVFLKILSAKLNPKELTYQRYLYIAEQVFLAIIDNLENLVYVLTSLKLARQETVLTSDYELEDHADRYLDQEQRVKELLQQNEVALTRLDELNVKFSELKTGAKHSDYELDQALTELNRYISRVNLYHLK